MDEPGVRKGYDAETQAWIDAAETKEERKKRQQRAKYERHGYKYRARIKKQYEEDPQKVLDRNAKYRAENPENVAAGKLEWERQDRAKHPEKYAAKWNAYYAANKDKVIARGKKWREENPHYKAAAAAYSREYVKKHRDEINRKQREAYAANPKPAKARGAKWRADNPEKYTAQPCDRRAKREGPFHFTHHHQTKKAAPSGWLFCLRGYMQVVVLPA